MDLMVSRRFDCHGLEHFAVSNKGITLCAYTPDLRRVYRALAGALQKNDQNTNVTFYDVESRQSKECKASKIMTLLQIKA